MSIELFTSADLRAAREALKNSTGQGVRIAILDSGVNTEHPALSGLQLSDDVMFAPDGPFLKTLPGQGDAIGHGTAIAWIIHHIAPAAELGSFRVLDGGLRSRSTVVWEAARLAIRRGYHILNCSFGCPGEARLVMPFKEWTDEAYLAHVHVVAACNNDDANFREWPGWFPTVITVNLASMTDDAWLHRPTGMVEFAAHGHDVELPWLEGWKRVTGSSFAAPRVTAALAKLLSLRPKMSVEEAKELLRRLAAEPGT
ncbi:MAG: S8 family serine peptidase [Prosthecobacter sp.]|nr:S8 family serine peptidase [Prosthecobacter sp.]